MLLISVKRSAKKYGEYLCQSCVAKRIIRPQNTKEFWQSSEIKTRHSAAMKSSQKYYDSLKTRDMHGINNGMFERKHTADTKAKMSLVRTGKTGKRATAWKGGKTRLSSRIRKALHDRWNWYYRVHLKSRFRCTECGAKNKKLDAHHIVPLSMLIRNISEGITFSSDDDKFEFLINHPKIKDSDTENGRSLCRECHKSVHNMWGSHVRP